MIIKNLGPISEDDLAKRSHKEILPWIIKLKSEKRISEVISPLKGLVVTEDILDYTNFHLLKSKQNIIRRYFESEGPVSIETICEKFSISDSESESILSALYTNNEIVKGEFIKDSPKTFWCNRDNFAQLYRRAISIRRSQITGVKRNIYLRFLLNWHGISGQKQTIDVLINRYQGYTLPPYFFEREILSTRLENSKTIGRSIQSDHFKDYILNGGIIVQCHKNSADSRVLIKFLQRGDGNIFDDQRDNTEDGMTADSKTIYQFLKENGASHFQDIESATDMTPIQIRDILQQIVRKGLITTDNYDSFLSLIGSDQKQSNQTRRRSSRHTLRQNVHNQILVKSGRWFLTSSFAVMGKKIPIEERLERQARLLLQRYGILVKEFYRRESDFLPWYQLFQVLKRMEWQGEIRRGYFIEGLSGIQFALPQAIELLASLPEKDVSGDSAIICTMDPALPFGGNINWELKNDLGQQIDIKRAFGNHLVFYHEKPVIYSENFGHRLLTLNSFKNKYLENIIHSFKYWLHLPDQIRPRKKIEIKLINDRRAIDSVLAAIFYKFGFEREGTSIVLWPSGL